MGAVRETSVAVGMALLVTLGAVVMRGLDVAAGSDLDPARLMRLLLAAAGMCAAGLLLRRSPAGAWLVASLVAAIAALEILGVIRAWLPELRASTWPWLASIGKAVTVFVALLTAAYATRSRRVSRTAWDRLWGIAVPLGFGIIVLASLWAVWAVFDAGLAIAATSPDAAAVEGGLYSTTGRVAAGFIAVTILIGAARDLQGPLARARGRAGTGRELPRALADEILPTAAAARRRAREEERAKLAADLHALVLPDLRRAARSAVAAESSGALRDSVARIERLMEQRQSVVLEEYGLVAALEWLAERTQQDARIDVVVELDGDGVDDPTSIPSPVGRAAFRIALLATDNVVRHADATQLALRLTTGPMHVRLEIADDGRGSTPSATAHGGRGMVDIRETAREIGGTIRLEPGEPGTRVVFTWGQPGMRDITQSPSRDVEDRHAASGA